jgi:hypothetical protein
MKLPRDVVERVADQLGSAELGDPRRSKRLRRVVGKLARNPGASLPSALKEDAEVQGAYRLINNRRVSFEAVLKPHLEATSRSAESVSEVLALHDTTDCAFPSLDPEEIGYLPTGKAGFRLHTTLAVDGSSWRRPLGLAHAETLFRTKRARTTRKRSGSETAAQPEREFGRWWRGIQASAEALAGCKRVVHIADRESDSYELMWQTMAIGQEFVFRVRVDRRSRVAAAVDSSGWSTVRAVAAGCEGIVEREVELSHRKQKSAPQMRKAHPARKGRAARLRFSATAMEMPRPQYLQDPVPKQLRVNLVHVVEVDPPAGESAVEWLLYTTLPIETPLQVEEIVDKYRTRWLVEEFYAALKTGCAYEEREFESANSLLVMLAMSLPIACELLWLRSRARTDPDRPATEVLTQLQLRVLHEFRPGKLSATPTVQEALLAVASLGGHLKRNGPPGWKVLHRGMLELHGYVTGWAAAEAAAVRRARHL